jgi:hypothetical protein
MFPNDLACARYLEAIRWRDGFACPRCGVTAEPFRFANRPQVLRCKGCKRDTALTAGTVMERTHTPLSVWFWAAFLISSLTPGMSAVQLQRQLGLTRYETAFQILHKLRSGMVRTSGRIGLRAHVEVGTRAGCGSPWCPTGRPRRCADSWNRRSTQPPRWW